MAQVYDEPIVVRLTVPVGPYPVGSEFGFDDLAQAIRALGSSSYFEVVRTQDGDPIPPPTPEDMDEARRQAMARARAARLVRGGEFDSLASVALEYQSFHALDIWPEFNANGGSGSWNAQTYTDYIAGLDASLQGEISSGTVVKTDLGASSGTERLYSYAAGSGPVGVLIVSGQHGGETMGVWAAMRWFQQFVSSNDAQMRQMRNAFRVTWIPVANPSRYRADRVNANGVDTNRNFDLFWERFSEGTTTAKGTAPESEPEAAIIGTLLRTGDFRHVLDCHNYSAAGNTVMFGLPGHYINGPRQFVIDTANQWQSLYGAGATWSQINRLETFPMLVNYANYLLRHVQGKADSTALTLEASADLFESTTQQLVSRPAMRAYAGMIHTHLLRVMENGFRETARPYSYQITGYRTASGLTTPISEGGALINTSTNTLLNITWATEGLGVTKTSMDIPTMAGPAYVYFEAVGSLRSTGVAGRHTLGFSVDGSTPSSHQRVSVQVTDTAGAYTNFSVAGHLYLDSLSNVTMPTLGVMAQRNTGGDAEVYNIRVFVTVMPLSEGNMLPRLGVS